MNKEELKLFRILDSAVKSESVRTTINSIVAQVERKLLSDSKALLAWENVPLTKYDVNLPDIILSSWVFILKANTNTGAERHPNSHQRVISYKGQGDLQIWGNGKWHSNHLISSLDIPLESRGLSIPPNTWHRPIVGETNWVVVSFHTVPEAELIEERLDPTDDKLTHQRKYSDK
ncbi:MAG: hypothetical protein JW967_07730 [Dehalococcoidales bacterium]|nr:hypothetical protein [Dehalococcoidales bacterium]